ncbi:MAG: hypothetical protein R3E01_17660 [Pirellulaceae bacterium]
MDATTRFKTQRVGALPFIVAYLEKIRLSQFVEEHVPWEGDVPLGTLVEIMICNRLLNPKRSIRSANGQKERACATITALQRSNSTTIG